MDHKEPSTRKESRKTDKEKRQGKEQLGSSKGLRAKEANLAAQAVRGMTKKK